MINLLISARFVQNYLKKFEYDNAEQDDLWEALTEQAHTDGTLSQALTIKQIMDTWTLRKGYPLVTINRATGSNQITLTQKWFLLNPLNTIQGTAEYDEYKWYIPFSYTSQETPNWDFESPTTWFMPNQAQCNDALFYFRLKFLIKLLYIVHVCFFFK